MEAVTGNCEVRSDLTESQQNQQADLSQFGESHAKRIQSEYD